MNPVITSIYNIFSPLVSDKLLVKFKFRWHMGYPLNLNNPKSLNEKINWLKLYDRSSLLTQCSDKFMVREFIINKIGDEYLVPLCLKTKNPNDIVPNSLPDYPVIIKTNHDSSGGIFVYDKTKINWNNEREKLKRRLKSNYYLQSREWQYKNIIPQIIVEKLLQNKNGEIPNDYKLHCFNGKVRMISLDIGRGTNDHYRNWYTQDWKRQPFSWSSPKSNGKTTEPSSFEIEKPSTLGEMIRLSEILAKSFTYVRVDWYDVDGKLFFGELTFHHDGGYRPILPKIWDVKLGNELILPTQN